MVDDILLTPEEQDERAKQWLKDNGLALILGVVLGLGAVFGYQGYQAKIKSNAEQASLLYSQVLEAVQTSELADISSAVQSLKQDYAGTPYAAKAVLLRAKQLAVSDLEQAATELQWVVEGAEDTGLRHTARIRLAKVLLAQDKLAQAKAVAQQQPYQGFDSNYEEILGDIAVREQEFEQARNHYQAALDSLGAADRNYSAILQLKINRLPVVTIAGEAAEVEAAEVEAAADATAGESAEAVEAEVVD